MVNCKHLIIFIFIQLGAADPPETNPCPDHWIQGTWVGLGCLLFNTTQKYSWEDAFAYCQKENSTLLEFHFQEQYDFLLMEIVALADQEGTKEYWWTAGTDLGKENRWLWLGSLSPVPDFVWYPSYPKISTTSNCLFFEPSWGYAGRDYSCDYDAMPICQKMNTL